jgi:hypothetical protein
MRQRGAGAGNTNVMRRVVELRRPNTDIRDAARVPRFGETMGSRIVLEMPQFRVKDRGAAAELWAIAQSRLRSPSAFLNADAYTVGERRQMAHAAIADQMMRISMSNEYAAELASVFGVKPEQVRITEHRAMDADLVRVRFLRGRSVAIALSSFLNHEFYRPAMGNIDELIYSPNPYSFVDDETGGAELCLTVNDTPDKFVERLRQLGPDIGFVALHPEMLLALREKGDYRAAREVVERGYAL